MNSRQRLGEYGQDEEIPRPPAGIQYFAEDDLLSIWNGRPAPYGGYDLVDEVLIVFYEAAGVPAGLELFDAAELLAPHLPISGVNPAPYPSPPDLEISYDAASDTLRMGNGRPQQLTLPIIENAVTVSFQQETGIPAELGGRIPSAVTIHQARRRIEAAIQSGLSEWAAEKAAANAKPVAG